MSFDDAINLEDWSGRILHTFEIDPSLGLPAKLYMISGAGGGPAWLPFLREGFGDEVRANRSPAPGALLIVRVRHGRRDVYLAFAFGIGRYLLRDNAYVRNFGLRVALNTVFEGDQGAEGFDSSRLRNVVSRRVSANPLRMQGQSSFSAALEAFDIDLDRDLLSGVTGAPQDVDTWGTRVTGADALHFNVVLRFDELEEQCKRLLRAHDGADYRARFSWIDDVSRVTDPDLAAELETTVIERLRNGDPGDIDLTVPAIVEWDRIQRFRLPYERNGRAEVRRPDLRLADYLGVLARRNLLDDLDGHLLHTHRIEALDADGSIAYPWSLWRCLSGELLHEGKTYFLDDGDLFAVSPDYLHELDDYLRKNIPPSGLVLPEGLRTMDEAAYNRHAAEQAGLLVLDRRTVRVTRSTTPVEVCDLLSPEGHLVHVKRKLGSSLLSHLFAQGFVSADLLLANDEFRQQAAVKVHDAIGDLADIGSREISRFDLFTTKSFDPDQFEVVYAVIANWQGRDFVDRLPFFSKVNLRRCAQDLRRRRFRVTHRQIDAV